MLLQVARSSLKDLILQEPQLYEMEDEVGQETLRLISSHYRHAESPLLPSPVQLLALLLMSERRQGKDSFWYPYIR